MKSVVVIVENAADLPREELDGRTPLEVARCNAAARLASEGLTGVLGKAFGRVPNTPEARLAEFSGLDSDAVFRVARGSLEAASLDVDLSGFTHAYRGDFVTLDDGVLRDGRLQRLTLQETEALAAAVQSRFDPSRVRICPVAPARVAVLVRAPDADLARGVAPWRAEEEDVFDWPRRGAELIIEMIEKSAETLGRHTINDVRVDLGENPANALWLWGGGPLARLSPPPLRLRVMTQSAMASGFAQRLGVPVEPLHDPWAAAHPSDVVDVDAMRRTIEDCDRLIIYVEAPDAFFRGDAAEKVHLLERLDVMLTQPLVEVMRRVKQRRIALLSVDAAGEDDLDPHVPQPIVIWGSHLEPDAPAHWDEAACLEGLLSEVSPEQIRAILSGEQTWR
jgi:2,3-bisphosphoglycerate-independent phosphoglycerate mutase